MVRLVLLLLLVLTGPARAQDPDRLRLDLVLDSREAPPFVGEMILATIRGTYRETITNEELKMRHMVAFDWVRLGHDRWTEQRVGGRVARVMERRIALFPKHAGRLEILPIAQELEILGAGGQRETVIVRSDPVVIDIRPKPAGAGQGWLPVRSLEISDHWSTDPGALDDDALAERRVILRALGATPEMMPTQPPLREPWLITFSPPEERDMQITPQGPVTTVVWRWSLRPITGEPGVLPEVVIPFYDATDRTARQVVLPASPIGYASFADNAASGWRSDLGARAPLVAVFLAAMGLVVALSLRSRAVIARPVARWQAAIRRRLSVWRLGRHLRARDFAAYRRLAAACMQKDGIALNARADLLKPFDEVLFGRGERPARAVLARAHRAVRARLIAR